jgi:hypothetical protein
VFKSDGELFERSDAGLRYHIILRSSAADRTDCRRRELKSIEMTAGHIQVTEARGLRPNLTSAGNVASEDGVYFFVRCFD